MSASPSTTAPASQKRSLEDLTSSSGGADQPDAKRPALNKTEEKDESASPSEDAPAAESAVTASDVPKEDVQEISSEKKAEGETNGKEDEQDDSVVADAPAPTSSLPGNAETQPIQSTSSNGNASALGANSHQDESGWLHVRAVISSAEAATVIGKGGENVTQIRRLSNAKCTVSEYSRGQVERILTVSGLVDAVAKVNEYHSRRDEDFADSIGIWFNHTNFEQRAFRRVIYSSIKDISLKTANSSYFNWLHNREVRCAYP